MIWRKNIAARGNSKDKSIEMRLRLEYLRKRESKCVKSGLEAFSPGVLADGNNSNEDARGPL